MQVKWLYRNQYMLMRYILQMLREGLRTVIFAIAYALVTYTTCLWEELPEEFIEKLLVGSFSNIGIIFFVSGGVCFVLGLIRLNFVENRVIVIQRWIVGSIGVVGGSIYVGGMLKNKIVGIASRGILDKTFITVFLILVLVDLLRYWVKCNENKKRV